MCVGICKSHVSVYMYVCVFGRDTTLSFMQQSHFEAFVFVLDVSRVENTDRYLTRC